MQSHFVACCRRHGVSHRFATTAVAFTLVFCGFAGNLAQAQAKQNAPVKVNRNGVSIALERMVKLYGASIGRVKGYGSGVIVSPNGLILTAFSPLLDAETITVVLASGKKHDAKLIAADPVRELALLKIDAEGMPFFDLKKAAPAKSGEVVYALSNLYNVAAGAEAVSVQRGVVASFSALSARQGFLEWSYPGKVYVLDTNSNNPGSAGGAAVNLKGELIGILGKEIKNSQTETWINFAIPVADFATMVEAGRAGKLDQNPRAAFTAKSSRNKQVKDVDLRGIIPLPDIIDRTPSYVDGVELGSPAHQIGLKPDDLVMLVADILVQSLADMKTAFSIAPADQPIRIAVLRGDTLVTLEMPARKPQPKK